MFLGGRSSLEPRCLYSQARWAFLVAQPDVIARPGVCQEAVPGVCQEAVPGVGHDGMAEAAIAQPACISILSCWTAFKTSACVAGAPGAAIKFTFVFLAADGAS